MAYAVKQDGQFRTVADDMELAEDETLYEQPPQWLIDTLSQQQTEMNLERIEADWRVGELAVIARQLESIEEDEAGETPPDLLPGTRKEWLKYRGQVSNWKVGALNFPDPSSRPISPA